MLWRAFSGGLLAPPNPPRLALYAGPQGTPRVTIVVKKKERTRKRRGRRPASPNPMRRGRALIPNPNPSYVLSKYNLTMRCTGRHWTPPLPIPPQLSPQMQCLTACPTLGPQYLQYLTALAAREALGPQIAMPGDNIKRSKRRCSLVVAEQKKLENE